jgi:hypothetical protein
VKAAVASLDRRGGAAPAAALLEVLRGLAPCPLGLIRSLLPRLLTPPAEAAAGWLARRYPQLRPHHVRAACEADPAAYARYCAALVQHASAHPATAALLLADATGADAEAVCSWLAAQLARQDGDPAWSLLARPASDPAAVLWAAAHTGPCPRVAAHTVSWPRAQRAGLPERALKIVACIVAL